MPKKDDKEKKSRGKVAVNDYVALLVACSTRRIMPVHQQRLFVYAHRTGRALSACPHLSLPGTGSSFVKSTNTTLSRLRALTLQ